MEKKKLKYLYFILWLILLGILVIGEVILRIKEYNLSLSEIAYAVFFLGWLGLVFIFKFTSKISFKLALILFVIGGLVSLFFSLGDVLLRICLQLLLVGFGQAVVELKEK